MQVPGVVALDPLPFGILPPFDQVIHYVQQLLLGIQPQMDLEGQGHPEVFEHLPPVRIAELPLGHQVDALSSAVADLPRACRAVQLQQAVAKCHWPGMISMLSAMSDPGCRQLAPSRGETSPR